MVLKVQRKRIMLLFISLVVSGWLTSQIFAQSIAAQNREAVTLWVAVDRIAPGEIITETKIQEAVFHGNGLQGLVTEKTALIGLVSSVNIPAGTPISGYMVESKSNDRIYSTTLANDTGLTPGDKVDVIFIGARDTIGANRDGEVVFSDVRVESVTPRVSLVVNVQTASSLARMERDGHLVLIKHR